MNEDCKTFPRGNYLLEIDVQEGVERRVIIGTGIRVTPLPAENLSVILGIEKTKSDDTGQKGGKDGNVH